MKTRTKQLDTSPLGQLRYHAKKAINITVDGGQLIRVTRQHDYRRRDYDFPATPEHLEALKAIEGTLVFYESPYRIEKLLGELNEVFPEREVVLARELTKKFEEFLRGKPSALLEIAKKRSLKGEFVVLVSGVGS